MLSGAFNELVDSVMQWFVSRALPDRSLPRPDTTRRRRATRDWIKLEDSGEQEGWFSMRRSPDEHLVGFGSERRPLRRTTGRTDRERMGSARRSRSCFDSHRTSALSVLFRRSIGSPGGPPVSMAVRRPRRRSSATIVRRLSRAMTSCRTVAQAAAFSRTGKSMTP